MQWSITCKEKKKGGLSTRDLALLNKALEVKGRLQRGSPYGNGLLLESMRKQREVSPRIRYGMGRCMKGNKEMRL